MFSLNKSLVQPHSIEAEFSVIGGLLLDNELFDEVSSKINEGIFIILLTVYCLSIFPN